MGSADRATRTAARRVGVSVEEYIRRVATGEKWCTGCKEWHAVTRFRQDRSRGDGRAAQCGAAAYTRKHPDVPGAAERRTRATAGEKWCRGCKAWLASDQVVPLRGVCRACANAEYNAHYASDGGVLRAQQSARSRGLALVPPWWREWSIDTFGGLCAYACGRPATSLDHVWPVRRGGRSRPGNLAPACGPCNSSKRDRDPQPWVDRGVAASPEAWADLIALAIEHGSDEWLEYAHG
jgi:5-methylcytosine-specific restriction endonuclease McrA